MLPLQFPTVLRPYGVHPPGALTPQPAVHLSRWNCSSAHNYSSSGSFPLDSLQSQLQGTQHRWVRLTSPRLPARKTLRADEGHGVCTVEALRLHNRGGSTVGRIGAEGTDLLDIVCPILRVLYLFPAIRKFCKKRKEKRTEWGARFKIDRRGRANEWTDISGRQRAEGSLSKSLSGSKTPSDAGNHGQYPTHTTWFKKVKRWHKTHQLCRVPTVSLGLRICMIFNRYYLLQQDFKVTFQFGLD